MEEKAKRLQPKLDVLRELFLKSGNQCAFSGCCNNMVDMSIPAPITLGVRL